MANVKISQFQPATEVKDTDSIPIVQDGINKKVASPILESKIINKTTERLLAQGGISMNLINPIDTVPTYASLSSITPTPNINDAYQVEADGLVYVYTNNGFQADGEGFKVQPDVNGIVEQGNTNAVSGGEVFSKVELKINVKLINGYYYNSQGVRVISSAYYYTEPLYAKEGMIFNNTFKGAGNAYSIIFWDKDGDVLLAVKEHNNIVSPENTHTVAFTTNSLTSSISLPSGFWNYQNDVKISNISYKGSIIKKGTDLAKIYEVDKVTSKNSIEGGFLDFSGNIFNSDQWYSTPYIPVRSGSVELTGLLSSNEAHVIMYDKNKVPIDRVTNSLANNLTFNDNVAYLRISNLNTRELSIIASTDIDMNVIPMSVLDVYNVINENKTISISNTGRFKIDFKLKVDPNKDNRIYDIISGRVIDLKLQTNITTTEVNNQQPFYRTSVACRLSNSSMSTYNNLGRQDRKVFEGVELFRTRHTGTNYNLYWECSNGSITLYESDAIIKSYSFETYNTIGSLVLAIRDDVSNSLIPHFEVTVSGFSKTPSSKISCFSKVPAYRTVTDKDNQVINTCFPTYFQSIDEKWHTLEIIIDNDDFIWCIDGYAFNQTYMPNNNVRKIGGELIFDFNNFEFRNLEISDTLDYSFPIIRTVYIHGAVDGIGETTLTNNTIDRTLEVDKAFKKRGFKSISYSQLLRHLKFGDPIPKRSYILCYDDSRNELYKDLNVRRKLMLNSIKTNNCAVMSFSNDEEVYIKPNVNIVGDINVGDSFVLEYNSKMTYLGESKLDGKFIFKITNPSNFRTYQEAVTVNKTYISSDLSVVFLDNNLSMPIVREEVPYSNYSELLQDVPSILKDYGFEIHLHDYRHEESLTTMNYEKTVENIHSGCNIFKQRYGYQPTGVVYTYGYYTVDHARIWKNEGVELGYTSDQDINQIGIFNNNISYILSRRTMDHGAVDVENYFTSSYNGLDKFLK